MVISNHIHDVQETTLKNTICEGDGTLSQLTPSNTPKPCLPLAFDAAATQSPRAKQRPPAVGRGWRRSLEGFVAFDVAEGCAKGWCMLQACAAHICIQTEYISYIYIYTYAYNRLIMHVSVTSILKVITFQTKKLAKLPKSWGWAGGVFGGRGDRPPTNGSF